MTYRHMPNETQYSPLRNLSNELMEVEGVCFDPDAVTLQGCYSDEISAWRARQLWIEALESNFLLMHQHDFQLKVSKDKEDQIFTLTCGFQSACARYAFWRLINNQAPEVQYIIETAHIPLCEARHEDILSAPDLRSIQRHEPLIMGDASTDEHAATTGLLRRILARICRCDSPL